ncbi:MAG: FecR domain-containing protein, partial [Bryobacterales bacterium]|nr:FecR domain-containing protein [Bryobacterales bacterium]
MSSHERNQDLLFEKVVEEVMRTEPTEAEMAAAADRVWARLGTVIANATTASATSAAALAKPATQPGVLRTQADYEALFAGYYRQELPEAQRELLEARLHEDVAMRQAWQEYKAVQEGRVVSFGRPAPRAGQQTKARFTALPRWVATAAMLAIAAGLSWYGWNAWGPAQMGPQATVQTANHPLYVVRGAAVEALEVGGAIAPNEEVRVPEGGLATIALRDGSLVELRESSSFRLSSFGDNLTVHLYGGDVIVEAAKRRKGHLYVQSRDVNVAVTGTVFAVGAGIKGSRVGVVEGSVQVAQDGRKLALKPGQQYASAAELTPVSVEQQIAWSQNFQKHLALMRSLTALETELAGMRLPSLRYSSSLAPQLPANTMIYASVPNLEDPIRQAREILSGRLQQDAVLREWMESHGGKLSVDTLLGELQGISAFAGEEMLLVSLRGADGKPGAPSLIAELRKEGFAEYLLQRLTTLAGGEPVPPLNVYHDLAALAQAGNSQGVHVAVAGGKLVLSPELSVVRQIAAGLLSQQEGFYQSDFGARVATTYRDGAGFFFAADLTGITSEAGKGAEFAGIDGLRFLEIEQQQVDGHTDLRSTFTFGEDRHGVASWLAAPGPLRALEFVTPGASAVMAAMVKDPVAMLEDALGAMANDANASARLTELEGKLNLRVRDDLAAPLGNEVAIALDGPIVPVPGWKVVVQVNDPVRLQTAIERLVEAVNREVTLAGKPGVDLTQEIVDGVVFHTLTWTGAGRLTTSHYVFAQGYLVAAPDRGLVRH